MFDIRTFIHEEIAKRKIDYTTSPVYLLEHYNGEKKEYRIL